MSYQNFPPFGEAREFFFFRFEDLSMSKSTLGCYSDRVLLLMAQSSARNLLRVESNYFLSKY